MFYKKEIYCQKFFWLWQDFNGHPVIDANSIDLCLAEIGSLNPSFPARAFHAALQDMKTETEKPPVKAG